MRNRFAFLAISWLALLAPASAGAGAAPNFGVSIAPATAFAEVDSLVTITLSADEYAFQFNAYEVTLQFDPAVVTFVSAAEGALMQACETFGFVASTDSTVTYTHSLLCAGISLDGPGVLSEFTFRGLSTGTSPVTIMTDPDWAFFDAGIRISPDHPTYPRQVEFQNGMVVIGSVVDAPEIARPFEFEFYPNPTRAGGSFVLDLPTASGPTTLDVYDAGGRRVFQESWRDAPTSVRWRATEENGRALPGGVYFARVRAGGVVRTAKVVLVR